MGSVFKPRKDESICSAGFNLGATIELSHEEDLAPVPALGQSLSDANLALAVMVLIGATNEKHSMMHRFSI